MESLESLEKFVYNYPQKSNFSLNYAFVGGTSIRLFQEKYPYFPKRKISDFDLIAFNNGKYPVHTLNPKIVFGLINLSEKEIKQCVTSLKARGKEYFSMDGSFLALTKSCAIDNPRQKDFDDLKYLFYKNEIDFDKLCCLFDKTYFLNNSRKIASENFKWFFSEEDEKFKSFLFGSFPNFVNLISNFENYYPSREFLLNFVKENSSKDRKSFSSVLYDLGLVFNKIDISEDEGKLKILASLLDSSKDLSHNEFNQLIQWKILPKFSKDKRKNKEILTCLI